jgi:hypothetical protein
MRNPSAFQILCGLMVAVGLQGCAKPEAQAPKAAAGFDLTKVERIPPGNYLCNLLINGTEYKLNFDIIDDSLQCVNASDKGMIGLRGKAQLLGGNGVFQVQLRGGEYVGTQLWVFNNDGSARIKEIPDRGERQRAVPVKGTTLEL